MLEPYFSIALILTAAAYFAVLWVVQRGLRALAKNDPQTPPDAAELPRVSIIIPCRNEADHIGEALDDLNRQDYPLDRLQIIVVDDRSTDGTGDVARGRKGKLRHLQVIDNNACPENASPKKHAISLGMQHAAGEILITTDGDCRFQPGWVRALVGSFAPDVGAVTGLTVFDRGRREPFWQRLQQLDYLSHSFFAAGAIGSGLAFNCNGSNLALRRSAFAEIGGYEQINRVVTGDDTLLIQRLRESGKWRVLFCTHPDSVVHSWPEETVWQVFNQRLRWGSGGLSYSPPALTVALLTFVFFLSLFSAPFLWFVGWISGVWSALFAAKILLEGRVLATGWETFGIKTDWIGFAILELLHIPAILTFSIGGHLFGFRWKGQRFKRTRAASYDITEATV